MAPAHFDLIPGSQGCGIVECRHGFMIYPRKDGIVSRMLGLFGEWSQGEIDLLGQYVGPGDTVVEVGSHIGCHTVPLARLVGSGGRVFAFEAQKFLCLILQSNLILNRLPQATALHAAISDQAGEIAMPVLDYTEDRNYGAVSMVPSKDAWYSGNPTMMLQAVTLDSYGFESCRLIKVDAEAMEPNVLRGAAGLITRHKPILCIENDRAENSDTIREILAGLGYEAWWHIVPFYNPDNFAELPIDLLDPKAHNLVSANLLAIHQTAEDRRPIQLERFL